MGLSLTFISHNGHRLVHKQFVWLIKLILQKDYIIDVKTVSKAENADACVWVRIIGAPTRLLSSPMEVFVM